MVVGVAVSSPCIMVHTVHSSSMISRSQPQANRVEASNVYVRYSTLTTSDPQALTAHLIPLLPSAFFQGCASVPYIDAAAWYTCCTTLLDLLGGVLALGAGTVFPRHMAGAFGVALVCALCAWSIAPSALAARLRPLDAVCVCRLLAVVLVHAGVIIIVQNQFIAENLFQVYPVGYVFTAFWGCTPYTMV